MRQFCRLLPVLLIASGCATTRAAPFVGTWHYEPRDPGPGKEIDVPNGGSLVLDESGHYNWVWWDRNCDDCGTLGHSGRWRTTTEGVRLQGRGTTPPERLWLVEHDSEGYLLDEDEVFLVCSSQAGTDPLDWGYALRRDPPLPVAQTGATAALCASRSPPPNSGTR